MDVPPDTQTAAIGELHTVFAAHANGAWTSGEVILDVAAGSRGLQATYLTPAGERKGFDDLDVFDAACSRVIEALELERPGVETTTRFVLAPDAAPSYETRNVEPDEDTLRDERWRSALTGAVAELTGGVRPDGYGTLISYRFGGPDPLEFVATVRRDEPQPHWLFVTNGFSEPDAADSADGPSGYGFELTLRVPRAPNDVTGEAPAAFIVLLQTLARYVFSTGSIFSDGDYTALPSRADALGGLAGLAFVADPELASVTTPNGTIAFRCAVGLTSDEMTAIQAWTTYGFIELAVEARKLSSNLITVPGRPSFLTDSEFDARARTGGARDGSRTGRLFFSEMIVSHKPRFLRPPGVVVQVDGAGLRQLVAVLPNRIGFDRSLTMIGPQHRVRFDSAAAVTLEQAGDETIVGLTADAAADLVRVFFGGAKRYAFDSIPLTLERT